MKIRCKHTYCRDCIKKRGRNYGNRRSRRETRVALAAICKN